jgi:hypothetical protein
MTKEEFYQQRKQTVINDFAEFRKTQTSRKACQSVAEKNNISYGLVNALIYQKDYNRNTTKKSKTSPKSNT